MKITNLTPHAVTVMNVAGGVLAEFPPSGAVARVDSVCEIVGHLDALPVTRAQYGEVSGLPAPEQDTFFIVSSFVLNACPERDDLLVPDLMVRDPEGRIVGCRALRILGTPRTTKAN